MGRILELSLKFNRSEEEEKEYQELKRVSDEYSFNKRYTDYTYEITDVYNALKYCHDDEKRIEMYNTIGRMQCKIEILKEGIL